MCFVACSYLVSSVFRFTTPLGFFGIFHWDFWWVTNEGKNTYETSKLKVLLLNGKNMHCHNFANLCQKIINYFKWVTSGYIRKKSDTRKNVVKNPQKLANLFSHDISSGISYSVDDHLFHLKSTLKK